MSNNLPTALETFFRIVPLNDGIALPPRKLVDFQGAASDDPTFQYAGETVGRTIIGGGGFYAPSLVPPSVADLIWVNQGGATATDSPGGGFDLVSPPNENGPNQHCKVQATPATPYIWTVGMLIEPGNTLTNFYLSALFRESATGKLITMAFSAGALVNNKHPDPMSGPDAAYSTIPWQAGSSAMFAPVWLRFVDDGTSLSWYFSNSGRNFTGIEIDAGTGLVVTHPKADYFTVGPNQVGVSVNSIESGGAPVAMHVFSWGFS